MLRLLTMCTQYGTLIAEVRGMMKTISVRKLRTNLAHVLKDVKTHLDRYVISVRGEPKAVLMGVEDFEGWLETLEIMGDKRAMGDIRQAKEELARGEGYSMDEVFGKPKEKLKR